MRQVLGAVPTLIVVEGVDRAGKTTECRRIMRQNRSRHTVMIHFVAPPNGQDAHVLEEMARIYSMAVLNPDMDFVLDRGHVSWFVYKELREPGSTCQEDLVAFEARFPGLNARTVLCRPNMDTDLIARDDGESTWTRKEGWEASLRAARTEMERFESYCSASSFGRVAVGAWRPEPLRTVLA